MCGLCLLFSYHFYVSYWIKKKLPYEQVIVTVDLDRSVEGQNQILYQCEIIGAIENTTKRGIDKKGKPMSHWFISGTKPYYLNHLTK